MSRAMSIRSVDITQQLEDLNATIVALKELRKPMIRFMEATVSVAEILEGTTEFVTGASQSITGIKDEAAKKKVENPKKNIKRKLRQLQPRKLQPLQKRRNGRHKQTKEKEATIIIGFVVETREPEQPFRITARTVATFSHFTCELVTASTCDIEAATFRR